MLHTKELLYQRSQYNNPAIAWLSDVYEKAYEGVVYFRGIDSEEETHISLGITKTKLASIKQMTKQ